MEDDISKAIESLSIENRLKLKKVLDAGTTPEEFLAKALANFFCALGV